jgi:hypothetical protein
MNVWHDQDLVFVRFDGSYPSGLTCFAAGHPIAPVDCHPARSERLVTYLIIQSAVYQTIPELLICSFLIIMVSEY